MDRLLAQSPSALTPLAVIPANQMGVALRLR
jgi:hypothetical protein